ncbi:MAG: hypothetical protein JJT78_08290 [Leptospira sp.]|nr:hypothetical protein [Leptospira sp.]
MGFITEAIAKINQTKDNKPYEERGFNTREKYLRSVAKKFNHPFTKVLFIALELGEEKDFDGLLKEVEFEKYDGFLEDYIKKEPMKGSS